MTATVKIKDRPIGDGHPVYIIAEIGINHNGDVGIAKRLIDAAVFAGCDAVKFQKRTPDLCVPEHQKSILRETPWGLITYLDYKKKIEFEREQYLEIDAYCKEKGIHWFASPWDEPSVDFLEELDVPCHKIASAMLTDDELLLKLKNLGKPLILSTGMSTTDQIGHAIEVLGKDNLILLHTTSTYPCPPEELNLSCVQSLKRQYPDIPIGYSGHEVGLQTTLAAAVLGATVVERHITLDRAMWGTDHAASVEPQGLFRLVRDIRIVEKALGDGVKIVFDSEKPILKKLRNN